MQRAVLDDPLIMAMHPVQHISSKETDHHDEKTGGVADRARKPRILLPLISSSSSTLLIQMSMIYEACTVAS